MKIIYLFLALTFLYTDTIYSQSNCKPGDAQIDLDINKLNVRLLNSGDLWWNLSDGRYIAPKPEPGFAEVSAIFAGGIWMGGTDPVGNLNLSTVSYRGGDGSSSDYIPGPLDGQTGQQIENACFDWDQFWEVTSEEIEAHRADYADNGIIDNPLPNIFKWPGRDNVVFEEYFSFQLPSAQSLAPFVDVDNNFIYNPEAGDYPEIKGDQAIWWVFNDSGLHTASFGNPNNIEVQVMAYAYNDVSENMDRTSFYDFKCINRNQSSSNDFHFGFFTDFDLGCSTDDYVGFDIDNNMMYAYNMDAVDGDPGENCNGVNTYKEKIPMVGISLISSSNDLQVSSFNYFRRLANEDPDGAFEYWNTLNGLTRDGQPFSYGDDGYSSNPDSTTKIMFTGDPSKDEEWSMCSANMPMDDYRALMSIRVGDYFPGQIFNASYAVVFVEDVPHPCPSIERLKEAAVEAAQLVSTNTKETVLDKNTFDVTIQPNPTNNNIRIESKSLLDHLTVYNAAGQLVKSFENIQKKKLILDVSSFIQGQYFIKMTNTEGNVDSKKFTKI